jgi:hypothetical protein
VVWTPLKAIGAVTLLPPSPPDTGADHLTTVAFLSLSLCKKFGPFACTFVKSTESKLETSGLFSSKYLPLNISA